VEMLVREHGLRVRVLAPHFGHCARVTRFRVELCRGDLAAPDSLLRACQGVSTVFHLAYSGGSAAANIDGARNLGLAALASGVRRFVHVSTVSIYGETPPGSLDEAHRPGPITDDYSATKAAVEKILLGLHREKGLPIAVLQPTIVYGPYGGPWTVRPLRQLRDGRLVLPADGRGICNAVYVDDVAEACLLAARSDRAVGQRFLVSGPQPVTWADFYRAYEHMMPGINSVTLMDTADVREAMRRANDEKSLPVAMLAAVWRRPHIRDRILAVLPPLKWGYRGIRSALPPSLRSRMRRRLDPPWLEKDPSAAGLPPLVLPDLFLWKLYSSQSAVSIDKARRELGYQPRFDLSRGMALTADWARWAGLLTRA